MLPKLMPREDLPKPHRKVSRLRTIGHQIRYYHYFTMLLPPLPPPLLPPQGGVTGKEEVDGKGAGRRRERRRRAEGCGREEGFKCEMRRERGWRILR